MLEILTSKLVELQFPVLDPVKVRQMPTKLLESMDEEDAYYEQHHAEKADYHAKRRRAVRYELEQRGVASEQHHFAGRTAVEENGNASGDHK